MHAILRGGSLPYFERVQNSIDKREAETQTLAGLTGRRREYNNGRSRVDSARSREDGGRQKEDIIQ